MAQFTIPGAAPATVTEHDNERQFLALRNGFLGPHSELPLIYADSTGMHVKVRANRLAAVRGSIWGSGSLEFTVAIAANAGPGTRTDYVVLKLDRSTWAITAIVVQGTAGAGAPAVTQDEGPAGVYEWPVAAVTVAQGAVTIASGNVASLQMHLAAPLLVGEDGAVVAGPPGGVYLRYTPSANQLLLHTQGTSTLGRYMLLSDSGDIQIDEPQAGWSQGLNNVIRALNGVAYLRVGTFTRTGAAVASGVDVRLPGLIPTAMRHPTRNQMVAARRTGGQEVIITIYRSNEPTRPGQLWITSHSGISNDDDIVATTVSWPIGVSS